MPATDEILLKRAKAMRSEMSQPERELWTALRARRFDGVKFSRQVVIGPYIVDFAARLRKLIIEVDGDSHAGNGTYDARRTAWLEQQGYRVIRFNNSDVMSNVEGVLLAIAAALGTAPLPNPLPGGERA
ncbi:endonuclease domain-containing protein [Sphingomonas sp. So64.6b]|uniref:endonuclease domain-containing protein n=1 Tax=Sphingomonas sp. So64.6b TaxID=2997354 RepID=UPI0015FF9182|nr:endonuclease domain-containing protein [Sphingomonas sp. So64.6b]